AGEEASKPGFDSIALWARTGLMDLVRASPDVPPARSLPGMGDHPTGMSLFAAIMTGLYQRERTGRGTAVSTSLLANGLWMNAIPVQGILCGARTEVRPPREAAISALASLYRCRDGRWFMLTITGDERHWESFARGIGREDLVTDPRFEATEARRANAPVLTAILDEWFETKDWAAWSPILEKTGVAFGVVATLDDVSHDAQMRASGALVPIDDPRAGASHTVSSPLHIGGQEKIPPDPGAGDGRAPGGGASRRGRRRRRDRATPARGGDPAGLTRSPAQSSWGSPELVTRALRVVGADGVGGGPRPASRSECSW